MHWQIIYSKTAEKQLERLDRRDRDRILEFMKERVGNSEDPREHGHSLHGDFAGQWTYRIGSYRAICWIHHQEVLVEVMKVAHRRESYR